MGSHPNAWAFLLVHVLYTCTQKSFKMWYVVSMLHQFLILSHYFIITLYWIRIANCIIDEYLYSSHQSELLNVTWHEVQMRLLEVQLEQQMCIHKQQLTQLGKLAVHDNLKWYPSWTSKYARCLVSAITTTRNFTIWQPAYQAMAFSYWNSSYQDHQCEWFCGWDIIDESIEEVRCRCKPWKQTRMLHLSDP